MLSHSARPPVCEDPLPALLTLNPGAHRTTTGTEWPCRELQLVRLLRQIVRERPRHAAGVIHLDDVPRDQVPEKIRVHAARQIVASRDGAERPSVVVEARG